MVNLLLYLIKSLLAGALLFSFYQFVVRKETYLRFSRIYLLSSALLMVVLPLTGSLFPLISLGKGSDPSLPVIVLPEVVITASRIISAEQQSEIVNWAFAGYAAVTLAMLGGLSVSLFRILKFYRTAIRAEKLEQNIYLVPENSSPFSFLGRIFISSLYASHPGLNAILVHENAHIRQKHMVDLIILELLSCVFWFNPFFYLVKRAMREVHEFLADREVIQRGAEPLTYQQLLFNEVSGNPQYIIANNFNLLTKKRIVMLIRKSEKKAALRIGILLPFMLAGAFVVSMLQSNTLLAQDNQLPTPLQVVQAPTPPPPPPVPPAPKTDKLAPQTTAKTPPASQASRLKFTAPVVDNKAGKEVQEKDVYKVVDKMPEYPGGNQAMSRFMAENIKYPQEAKTKGVTGVVFVAFIIEKDGSVSNVSVLRGVGAGCNEEAMRVVSKMPKWKPGENKGKPVRVEYNLPVKFKLN